MKIYRSLAEILPHKGPISLALGVFDGVHIGHQHLFNKLKEKRGTAIALTFTNNPKEILAPTKHIPSLTTAEEKLHYLSKCGLDAVVILPFSKDIAGMTYQAFLKEIYKALPFHHLFIGENDAFGKGLEGTNKAVAEFAKQLKFIPHFLPKFTRNEKIVSSTWIREALRAGDVQTAERLLGRPVAFSKIDKNLFKSGKYKVRILPVGEEKYINDTIIIEENASFELDYPATITFITQEEEH